MSTTLIGYSITIEANSPIPREIIYKNRSEKCIVYKHFFFEERKNEKENSRFSQIDLDSRFNRADPYNTHEKILRYFRVIFTQDEIRLSALSVLL